jgi:hypothetical protein
LGGREGGRGGRGRGIGGTAGRKGKRKDVEVERGKFCRAKRHGKENKYKRRERRPLREEEK